MEPWQKLFQTLCEIWVEQDIRSGKIKNEQITEEQQQPDSDEGAEDVKLTA